MRSGGAAGWPHGARSPVRETPPDRGGAGNAASVRPEVVNGQRALR